MNNLSVGQRLPLSQLAINETAPVTIKFIRHSGIEVDISCFALDATGKLISDDYMVFYNQPASPCGQIKLNHYQSQPSTNKELQAEFEVTLSALPTTVDSLYFVLSADAPLNQIQSLSMTLWQSTQKTQADYLPADFAQQQASMLIQLYRKGGVWRLANVAQGFNGGLAAIVKHFGGDVEEGAQPSVAPAASMNTTKPSLDKIMLQKAPKLVNLAKKASISLEKRQLSQLTAKVALVLDATGSMNHQYEDGRVQEVVNRLLPIGVSFDDNQTIDCWAFGKKVAYLGDIDLNNYDDFIKKAKGGWRKWDLGARINNEAAMIEAVTKFYQNDGNDVPVYVLFISDGGVSDKRGITKSIVDAAKYPIFWQFVGLGGRSYGILEKLDDMTGRVVDNCNFFALDRLSDISEEMLYDKMLEEFPTWLKDAKRIGVLA